MSFNQRFKQFTAVKNGLEYYGIPTTLQQGYNMARRTRKSSPRTPRRGRSMQRIYPTPSSSRALSVRPMSLSRSRSRTRFRRFNGARLPYRRFTTYKGKARLRKPCNLWKKPPRRFVKKVEAVLSKDTPCGLITNIGTWDSFENATLANQYRQLVHCTMNNSFQNNWFTWGMVMDAAAIMYNGKTPTENGWNSMLNNFDSDVKIVVEKQSVIITALNNFTVGGTLKCLTCFPKNDNNYTLSRPDNLWNDAKAMYVNKNAANPLSPTDNTAIFDMPTKYHAFNNAFRVHTESVYLGPGKSHKFVRNGPCMTYDFTKSKIASTDTSYAPNSKGVNQWTMFIWVPDLCQINFSAGNSQRIARQTSSGVPTTSAPGDMVFEWRYNACIRAPDDTAPADKDQVISFNNYAQVQTTALGLGVKVNKPLAGYNATA